jgi:hypothetical protein
MWRCVGLLRTVVSEEGAASIFRVEKVRQLVTANGFFNPEDGGDTFLRNVGSNKIHIALHSSRYTGSNIYIYIYIYTYIYTSIYIHSDRSRKLRLTTVGDPPR